MAVQVSALARLTDEAARFFRAPYFSVLTTIGKDGQPHSSMIWVKRDGDDLLMVTVRDRQKWRDLVRDPRATLLAHDPENPYHYVEVRGTVTLTEEGGRELMDELCRAYTGEPWEADPGQVRVVVRLTPAKIVVAKVPG
ncbi:PPOX class F420-dependent oxidoreductase [Amycolatopsis anabasis]|uniref:PPOX class F420-dependent oxidoreductase n=1 Tax=Amycolatopsis anabasis TaxID=1840409 RepID=UPI00131BF2BB|nr:PPOX class F420-dependent oxidoreductase [Amycolatopsis anabasis]